MNHSMTHQFKYSARDVVLFGFDDHRTRYLGRILDRYWEGGSYRVEQLQDHMELVNNSIVFPAGTQWIVEEDLIRAKVADKGKAPPTMRRPVSPQHFWKGQSVVFIADGGHWLDGFIVRVNKKTCTCQPRRTATEIPSTVLVAPTSIIPYFKGH